MLKFKNYLAKLEYDEEIEMFRGVVINTSSHIDFYSDTVAGLKDEFKKSVETYLEVCREHGIRPDRPFSGKFNLRLGSALHAAASACAEMSGATLNQWVKQIVAREAKTQISVIISGEDEVNSKAERSETVA